MRSISLKIPARLWEQVHLAAGDQGISASQYVREAVFARLALEDPSYAEALERTKQRTPDP